MGNYLYNGVELPAVPEKARKYKYIAIVSNSAVTKLIASDTLEFGSYYSAAYGTQYYTKAKNAYICELSDGTWEMTRASGTDNIWNNIVSTHGTQCAFWANVDIPCKSSDGTEYIALEGSNPIDAVTGEEINLSPVPRPQLNHAALMQGFATMLSLRK